MAELVFECGSDQIEPVVGGWGGGGNGGELTTDSVLNLRLVRENRELNRWGTHL